MAHSYVLRSFVQGTFAVFAAAAAAACRNFLAVQGPGVQAGVVDSTLLDVTDILPTMADFARAPANVANHLPWDGISFKNLLVPSAAAAAAVAAKGDASRRGDLLANKQQQDRYIFMLGPNCWSADAVPDLQRNRWERVYVIFCMRSAALDTQLSLIVISIIGKANQGLRCAEVTSQLFFAARSNLPISAAPGAQ
jgi:hypothetical protein